VVVVINKIMTEEELKISLLYNDLEIAVHDKRWRSVQIYFYQLQRLIKKYEEKTIEY